MFKNNNSRYLQLDQQDVNQIEYIHHQLWFEKAEMGPRLQFEVFQRFLEKRGYEIKEVTPETGDVSPEDQD